MTPKCLNCSREFYTKPSSIKRGNGKYCSQKCYFEYSAIKQRATDFEMGLLKDCVICSKEFKVRSRDIINGHGKCCSKSCSKKYFHLLNPDIYSGENSNFWKGGVNPLRMAIRDLREYKEWIKRVFKRDNFICQECGTQGGELEAHHIKSFSELVLEFLRHYNQFSPIEDKETLIRLAVTHEPFWDTTNGQTLCKGCHSKTENYLKRIILSKVD